MSLSLTLVEVTPTTITPTPAPVAIPYQASVINIPAHVTSGTNNGSESDSSDGILDIIETEIPPDATVALSSLHVTIQNALSRAQGSLQEENSVAEIPNTVSYTSEPLFMEFSEQNINDLLMRL